MARSKLIQPETQGVSKRISTASAPSADFFTLCQKAGVEPSRRQAAKFRQGRGIAWTWRGGKVGLKYRPEEK